MNQEKQYHNPYLRQLMSDKCRCGWWKAPKKSLCLKCFRRLPHEMRVNLYRRIGEGYEEAYDAAVKWLEEINKS